MKRWALVDVILGVLWVFAFVTCVVMSAFFVHLAVMLAGAPLAVRLMPYPMLLTAVWWLFVLGVLSRRHWRER